MEQEASDQRRGNFRFLSHEEFTALPQEEKVVYLKHAIRAVSNKLDEVLGDGMRGSQFS